jgi:hypothetical protein
MGLPCYLIICITNCRGTIGLYISKSGIAFFANGLKKFSHDVRDDGGEQVGSPALERRSNISSKQQALIKSNSRI